MNREHSGVSAPFRHQRTLNHERAEEAVLHRGRTIRAYWSGPAGTICASKIALGPFVEITKTYLTPPKTMCNAPIGCTAIFKRIGEPSSRKPPGPSPLLRRGSLNRSASASLKPNCEPYIAASFIRWLLDGLIRHGPVSPGA